MRKRTRSIPVNHFGDGHSPGMSIERMSVNYSPRFEGQEESHRHDRHSFFLLEKGTVAIEIDFQKHHIRPSSIIYMHPDQVHRITAFKNVTVSSWAIDNESLNAAYLALLEEITPAKPLVLNKETFSLISEAVSLFIKFSERKKYRLYDALLKDSCNALVALVASQYLARAGSKEKQSRFEIVTRAFRQLLEHNYMQDKRPAAYAKRLNISAAYLNECIKNTSGHSVSQHIQQRIILEAKRMLYHSDRSVKEIATALGYDDYPYFSRLFTKATGMTALTFRKKNRG